MISPTRSTSSLEKRALILGSPDPVRDSSSCRILMEAGVPCLMVRGAEDLCREMEHGVAVLILSGDAIADGALQCLADALMLQPDWSDIPIVVLGGPKQSADAGWRLLNDLTPVGSVTLLEHPVRPVSLVSSVLAGIRARQLQYEMRDVLLLGEQQQVALRQSMEALRDADSKRDILLAHLAHELRNPLGPIRNAVHVLDILGPQEAELSRVRQMIDRQVSHMARLLDDLLDVSRLTSGRIGLRCERIDLVPLIHSTIDDHRAEIEAAGLSVTVSTPSTPLWVSGDPTRLSQILDNLLHNAWKFTDRGGFVKVEAALEEATGMVRLVVEDTGIGMEPALLSRVFDSFTQARRSHEKSSTGLGLGLALVRGLVELHGGTVEATSEGLGRGSRFTVRFPADETPDSDRQPDSQEGDTSVFRILIVEDNVDAAESLNVLLHLVGHTVATAHNGPDALEKAREFKPDVVLCDIGLPDGMDGYQVARMLRSDAATRNSYLIALTGYGQEEDLAKAKVSGFDLHLTKPVDPAALRRLLSGPLRGSSGPGTAESGYDSGPSLSLL